MSVTNGGNVDRGSKNSVSFREDAGSSGCGETVRGTQLSAGGSKFVISGSSALTLGVSDVKGKCKEIKGRVVKAVEGVFRDSGVQFAKFQGFDEKASTYGQSHDSGREYHKSRSGEGLIESKVKKVFSEVSEILRSAKEGVKTVYERVNKCIEKEGFILRNELGSINKDIEAVNVKIEQVRGGIIEIKKNIEAEYKGASTLEVSARVFDDSLTAASGVLRKRVNVLIESEVKVISNYIKDVEAKIVAVGKEVDAMEKSIKDKHSNASTLEVSARVFGEVIKKKLTKVSESLKAVDSTIRETQL